MADIRFRIGNDLHRDDRRSNGDRDDSGYGRQSRDYDEDVDNNSSRRTEQDYRRDEEPPREENGFRRDYLEKFGTVARERQRVEDYRRWEMSQLLYGPAGKPSRARKTPQVMHSKQFEVVMRHICELYDIEYGRIRELVPESKRIASVHAKGCFICRLCRHTWASEMAWVDIDLWEGCICCYYQQKCMHCCEEKESAAIPMFLETQQRRLVCRSFLRSGLIRLATLSLKVFLAGPQRPKSTTSKPHLGLLCGKCGYDNCDLPPCSAADEGKADKADKKLAALYDDMRDKATSDPKQETSGETITISNAAQSADGGGDCGHGCSHGKAETTLRRPKFESAGHKRSHFKTISAPSKSTGKARVSVHDRLGPLKSPHNSNNSKISIHASNAANESSTGDGPAAKRPRKPITMDGLSPSPDKDQYVSSLPDVKPAAATNGSRGRRQKSLLLSHLERAAAKSRMTGHRADDEESNSRNLDDGDEPMDVDSGHRRSIKQEKAWRQFSSGAPGEHDVPSERLPARTEEEWQQHCLVRVEDADGEVEYMYTVNVDGNPFGSNDNNTATSSATATSQLEQTMSASVAVAAASSATTPPTAGSAAAAGAAEHVVVGLDGQPLTIKREKDDPAYYVHMAGDKPVQIKQELPWMHDGTTPWKDPAQAITEEENSDGMYLVEDADGDVEYLYTKYAEPAKVTVDDDGNANGGQDDSGMAVAATPTSTEDMPMTTTTATTTESSATVAESAASAVTRTAGSSPLAQSPVPGHRLTSPAATSPAATHAAAPPAHSPAVPAVVKKEPVWDDDLDVDVPDDNLLDYDFDDSIVDQASANKQSNGW